MIKTINIIILYILPLVTILLLLLFINIENKYKFIDILLIPKKISHEEYNNILKNSKRPELNDAYILMIKDYYYNNNKEYLLKDNINKDKLKDFGDFLTTYLERPVIAIIFLILLLISVFTLVICFILLINLKFWQLYIIYLIIIPIVLVGIFLYGTFSITGQWP